MSKRAPAQNRTASQGSYGASTTIRVVESEELRERQLAVIVRLLRRTYDASESGEDVHQRS